LCFVAQLPAPVIPLDGNLSAVEQYGDYNSYDLEQDGTRNFAEIYTDGDYNKESFVDQDGAWNTSTVDQDGGNYNWVDVTQENMDPENGWDLNFSYIRQHGDHNDATVVQNHQYIDAHPGPLVAYTFQPGTYNSSTQQQKGMIDLAIVYQNGDYGTALQNQGMSSYGIDGKAYGSLAVIGQIGSAYGSEAEQEQHGAWNVAGIIQGSDYSQARQLQVSDQEGHINNLLEMPNVAGIIQLEGAHTHNNEAYQVQYFDGSTQYGNWAGVFQMGGHNTSMQQQVGGNNASGVIQVGIGNNSDVRQTSTGASMPFTNPWD